MSDPETIPAGVHQEVALLPWYLNGTLSEVDRRQLDQHLASCQACRTELAELTGLKTELTALHAAQPGPSPHTARHILANVRREAALRHSSPAGRRSRLNGVDDWVRMLLLPRWAPTLAAALLLAQLGLILWIGMPMPRTEEITTRSLGMQTAKIAVLFRSTASEEQIRGLLQSIHGRIIDGPTADGRYLIEVPTADRAAVQQKLDILKGRPDVVGSADPARP